METKQHGGLDGTAEQMREAGYRLEEDDGKKMGVYAGKKKGKHWIWTK
jgi:hypothetical protein